MAVKDYKRIITCAITGSVHTPTMSEYLPITPGQIGQSALDAADAGAAVVHIHARNPENGCPTQEPALFAEIIEKIRARNKDLIICLTTGGGAAMTVTERAAVVPGFKPELASFNLGSMNFGLFTMAERFKEFRYPWEGTILGLSKDSLFQNTFGDLEYICRLMEGAGTKPEMEAYDIGHIYTAAFLLQRGWVKAPVYLQFVTGTLGGIGSTPYDIINLHTTAERLLGRGNYQWSVIGAGRAQFPVCTQGLLLGSHVRVGLEDNLHVSKGILAKSNAELVEKMVTIMREFDLEPAAPDEARELLSLRPLK